MKRIIIALTLLLVLATNNSFANEVNVTVTVAQAFKAKFGNVQNVSWSQIDGFYVAEFTMDDSKHFAYYTNAGELTVVAQPLTIDQLSKAQVTSLKKEYADYTITDIYQLEDNDNVKYYVVIENASKKIILNTESTKWSVFKTTNK